MTTNTRYDMTKKGSNPRKRQPPNFIAWETIGKIVETAIKFGCGLGATYFIHLSIKSLVGLKTDAKINLSANLQGCDDITWPYWVAAICFASAFSGVTYGYVQLQAKRETISTLTAYITKLERLVDKKRTSSGINRDGTTHPGDM